MASNSPYIPSKSTSPGETIAAISTPFGESGIGIVRLSGPLAESIWMRLFRSKSRRERSLSHYFHYGDIVDPETEASIDEVFAVLMKGPSTYTREDVLEIHCHGGYVILQKVLGLMLNQGARMAQPGEFTRRAFLNGRIDLTQAEAVIDVIKAKTTEGLKVANMQLKGMLFREMETLRGGIIHHLALLEAHIDFPEEELDPISNQKLISELDDTIEKINSWIETYEEGRTLREGVSFAIIGKTNVGKSSLLNALLKEERAIVTPIPGTTRDVIEEMLNIKGIPIRLIDTAGLRRTVDCVEMEGVKRAGEQVVNADTILLVLDGSRELDEEDLDIIAKVAGKKKVVVINKIDLPPKLEVERVRSRFLSVPIVSVSALKRDGIDGLKEAIYESLFDRGRKTASEPLIIGNLRHKVALQRAEENLSYARDGLADGISLEFVVFELRSALESLAEIVGETTPEDVLDRIFSEFCIGK